MVRATRRQNKFRKHYFNKIMRKIDLVSGCYYKKIFRQFMEEGKYIDWNTSGKKDK